MSSAPGTPLTVTLDRTRAFWHRRQGLAEPAPPDADPAAVLAATGWARTLGGIDVYLAITARCPGASRAGIDEAVRAGALRVVPAVRGCIYLVPEADVALVMALAAELQRPRTGRDLDKVGATWDEVETLADEVEQALAAGPLSTQAVRKALPAGSVKSLGAAGKKVGLTSLLPVALRELEFERRIERTPVGGRLDTERYEWSRSPGNEAAEDRPPGGKIDRLAAIARRFFEFFAPATVRELATWVGVPQRDAKAAMAELPLEPVEIEGRRGQAWVLAGDRESLAATAPPPGSYSFLPFEDNLLTVHGGPSALVDPAHHGLEVPRWGGSRPTTLGEARHIGYRPLIAGEKVVGFWEYDPDAGEVVTATFEPLARGEQKALGEARERVAARVRDDLGHARSFSLDTDDALRRRAAQLRRMG